LISAFISYGILMLVKYSVFGFKLGVIPFAYDIKMKSGGCASSCSVLSLPLCDTGITVTLVLVAAHASCAKPFAVENTLYSRTRGVRIVMSSHKLFDLEGDLVPN